MTPYEALMTAPRAEQAALWMEQCTRCEDVQRQVLADILARAQDTVVGRRYDFAALDSVEAYQGRVPVVTYDDIREDIQAVLDGESDVLFAGRPKLFLQSSGTTGEPKLLPESPLSAGVKYLTQTIRELYSGGTVAYTLRRNPRFDQLVRRKGWGKGRDTGRKRIFADCHILPLVTASSPKAGQQKVKVDFASNQSARKSNTAPIIIYPMAITQIANKEAMMYLIMMFSLRYDDVVEVAGNHAGRLTAMVEYARDHAQEMIDDIRQGAISPRLTLTEEEREMLAPYLAPLPERACELERILLEAEFTPRYYWPYLSGCVFWLSGYAGRQIEELRPYLAPETAICDLGYGASEAKINIPTESGKSSGTLAAFGVFYEFLRPDDGEIFTAWQVEEGQVYVLLLTTYGGLYRYNLGDVVRIDGFHGDTPKLTFLLRLGDILSIGQEKFPATLLCRLVEEALPVRLCQVWLNYDASRYELYIEPAAGESRASSELAAWLDDYLQEQYAAYGRYRQYGVIKPLTVHRLPASYKERLMETTIKVPLVLKAPPTAAID